MENSRCREGLNDKVRESAAQSNPQKTGVGIHLFRGGYSSMVPRFSPIVTAWVRSFAPSFERMFLTCPLTVSSVVDNLSAISLLAFQPATALGTCVLRGVKGPSAAES